MPNTVLFKTSVGGDGTLVTDDTNAITGLAAGGHRTRFVPALGQTIKVAEFVVSKAEAAANSAAASAASAASAVNSPGTSATAVTGPWTAEQFATYCDGGNDVGVGQIGKLFVPGQHVVFAQAGVPGNQFVAVVTAFNSANGVGRFKSKQILSNGLAATSWFVALSGPPLENFIVNEMRGDNITCAAVTDVSVKGGNFFYLIGGATVNQFLLPRGAQRSFYVSTPFTLTNNALIDCPTGASIAFSSGDRFTIRAYELNQVIVTSYQKVNGRALVETAGTISTEVRAGTVGDKYISPLTLNVALGFSAGYQSGDQIITTGGTLTLAHGLGRTPRWLQGFIRWKIAFENRAVGHIEAIAPGPVVVPSSASPAGYTVRADSTNIYIKFTGDTGRALGMLTDGAGAWALHNTSADFFVGALA